MDEIDKKMSRKTCQTSNKCTWKQKKCGRNSRCVKRRKSCPTGYEGIAKQNGKRGKRCCCKKLEKSCKTLEGRRCKKSNKCGQGGYCTRNKCRTLGFLDMILDTGTNMEMDIKESDKDLDNGNYGNTELWSFQTGGMKIRKIFV